MLGLLYYLKAYEILVKLHFFALWKLQGDFTVGVEVSLELSLLFFTHFFKQVVDGLRVLLEHFANFLLVRIDLDDLHLQRFSQVSRSHQLGLSPLGVSGQVKA